jgi:dienelactone hydrolase
VSSSPTHGLARPTERAQPPRIGVDRNGVTGGRPIYLELEPAGTLMFLHEPAGAGTRVGTAVLLCPPFGWEEVCCSRSLRGAATILARAGYPTARLTLPGTADGAGGPRDGDLLSRWVSAVGATAAWLRERTGASRSLALGIGLGGMLAYLAARDYEAIDDLALWGVPDRGRALLRDSKSLSKVIAAEFPEDQGRDPVAEGDIELIGYVMTAETEAAISELELSAIALPGCDRRRVLLLSRDAVPVDRRLQDALERRGAEVSILRTTDYYRMMLIPEHSETPAATVQEMLGWLAREPVVAECISTVERRRPRVRETPELELDGGVVETPLVCSGERGHAFGIVSRQATAGRAPLALVLLSAGALPHTGPNRAWVEMARRWAARGIPTIRLDLAGMGEAGGEDRELLSDDSIHEFWRVDDVRRVLDVLEASGTADRFVLGGLCNGAYYSLHEALTDSRVSGLLFINLFVVTWSGELIAERARRAASVDALTNDGLHGLDCSAERRNAADAIAAFDRLRERGTEALLLFGEQEPLYEEFARQGLLDQFDRWPNLRLERIPSRDQMFRAGWLQRHVHERVDEAIEGMLARFSRPANRNRLLEEVST